MGIAVDEIRTAVYTGNAYGPYGCTGDLVRTDYTTGVETFVDVQALTGAAGDCVVGLAVDLATGLVYVTTGNQGSGGSDALMVFDEGLNLLFRTADIGSPTGLVIPRTAVSYNPLNLGKDDQLSAGTCVRSGDTITYAIGYSNTNTYGVSGVVITDTLPAELDFVSASGGGTFAGGTVTWDIGDVPAGVSGSVTMVVTVKPGAPADATITNYAAVDSDQTGPAYANEGTPTCSANLPPVAVALPDDGVFECTSPAGALVTLDGTGSSDPDGDPLTYAWDPAAGLDDPTSARPSGTFALGAHVVHLTATDPSGASATDDATLSVVDTTPPAIDCNAHDIVPSDAPVVFMATATDLCGGASVAVTGYDCWAINGSGKRISKLLSCQVGFRGPFLKVIDSGGVGDHIDWTVVATDASGNTTTSRCSIAVNHPNK